MTPLWNVEDDLLDEDDKPEKLEDYPDLEDKDEERLDKEEDVIYCPMCEAEVEDGFQCDICGWMVGDDEGED